MVIQTEQLWYTGMNECILIQTSWWFIGGGVISSTWKNIFKSMTLKCMSL